LVRAAPSGAQARHGSPRALTLVPRQTCLAGQWERIPTRHEGRVQFGAFDDDAHADAMVARLARAGAAAAGWPSPEMSDVGSSDVERVVVISHMGYPSLAPARAAARGWSAVAPGAFARRVRLPR